MLVIGIAVLVMLLGLVLYAVAMGKWAELGRIMFEVGLLVTLLSLSGHALRISA